MYKKLYILLACMFVISISFAQRTALNSRPDGLGKMPIVFLEVNNKFYPKSYLARVNNTSIMLINKTMHRNTWEDMYFKGSVDLKDVNRIMIVDRKKKWRNNLVGALLGGAAGYFVGNLLKPGQLRQNNIELIGQPPQNGFVEPILGTLVGASVGMIVGDRLTPVTIEHVNRNPERSARQIREAIGQRSRKSRKGR